MYRQKAPFTKSMAVSYQLRVMNDPMPQNYERNVEASASLTLDFYRYFGLNPTYPCGIGVVYSSRGKGKKEEKTKWLGIV